MERERARETLPTRLMAVLARGARAQAESRALVVIARDTCACAESERARLRAMRSARSGA